MSDGICPTCGRSIDRWEVWEKRVRDIIIFCVGIFGTLNELALIPEPRPVALLFVGALTGVPFILQADQKRRENGK